MIDSPALGFSAQKSTINAISKLSDLEAYGIPTAVIEQWRARHGKHHPIDPDHLTHLQQSVFRSEIFWTSDQNLLVQGQTSSGKTLVGEVAAAHCIARRDKSAIYLVPFRAMVAEKYREFEAAFGRNSAGWQVYPSSSDYQEYDGYIAHGRYKLAIMVYEKLFALLAQPRNRVLQNCGLIVVDECQMVGERQRGPKLEFILSRFAQDEDEDERQVPRILGLTSISSEVDNLSKWLSAEVLSDPSRPKQLKESVCTLAGDCKIRIERPDGTLAEEGAETLKLFGANRDAMLLQLARYHLDQGHRVLIFRSSKRNTVNTAEKLAKMLQRAPLPETVLARIREVEDDETVAQLRDKLLPFGVAYHNASLAWEVRDLIEDEFKSDAGCIRAVVATETLAIGVNLPADVVIVSDLQKFSGGDGGLTDITAAEYKNYVGRAGRFGRGQVDHGRSYLIAESKGQSSALWGKYVQSGKTAVVPAFISLKAADQAPYVLNWISNSRNMTREVLQSSLSRTLSYSRFDKGKITERINSLCALLEKAELVDEFLSVTARGEAVAGYAISLNSTKRLRSLLLSLEHAGESCLPVVDIFFAVCRCEEIEAFSDPELTQQDYLMDKPLWKQLRAANLSVTPGSEFDKLRESRELPPVGELRAMKRALLLYYWRTGQSMSEIRRETKLAGVSVGDIARLADVSAFLIEALASLSTKWEPTQKLSGPLRVLAGTVHYGVPERAVPLANQHVRGVSRPFLKKLCDSVPNPDLVAYLLVNKNRALSQIPPNLQDRLTGALSERLRYDRDVGRQEHAGLVNRLVRKAVLDDSWKGLVEDLQLADTAEYLGQAVASLLSAEPIGLECHSPIESGFVMNCPRAGAPGVAVSVVYGDPDALLTWPVSASNVPQIVVGSTEFDNNARWSAENARSLLITRSALVQACLRSIIDTRGAVPVARLLAQHSGYVNHANVDAIMDDLEKPADARGRSGSEATFERDVFLCHAGPDESRYVRPLADALDAIGITYWLAEAEIKWGDSIPQRINEGLRRSRYVVLFVSEEFCKREWTEAEVGAALHRQISEGTKVLLPLLLMDRKVFADRFPLLAPALTRSWEGGPDPLAHEIASMLKQGQAQLRRGDHDRPKDS